MDPAGGEFSGRSGRSLTKTAASGVAWTSALSLSERLFTLVSQFILAGLLSLETWGAWGIILSVVLFVSGFASTGVREVLIHRSRAFHLWGGPALWASAVWGLILSGVLIAAAWPASLLVEEEWRRPFLLGLLVSAPVPLLLSLMSVCAAKLSIDHRFKAIAVVYSVPGIAQVMLTVAMAWGGYGIMAFAVPYMAMVAVRAGATYWISGVRPTRRARVRCWKHLASDSGRVWVETTAVWIRGQADVLLLGLFADQAAVGLYTFARNMSRQMVTLFTQQVASVIQPVLVLLRDDPPRMLSAFMRATRLLSFMAVPMTLGIGAVMWPGTPLLLDETKWAGLPLVLSVMVLGVALRVLTESSVSLKYATGLFREQQLFSVLTSMLFGVLILCGAWLGGVLGASVGFAVFCLVSGPLQFLTAVRPIGGGWVQTYFAVFHPVVLSLVSIAPWVVLAEWMGHRGRLEQALEVGMVVACSAATYLVLTMALRLPELRELAERLREQAPGRLRPLVVRMTEPMMVRGGRAA